MPSDIRSFFGGTSQVTPAAPEKESAKKTTKKTSRSRKTLDDSDDEVVAKKPSPRKAPVQKRDPTPEGEALDASDYFGKGKPKKSAPSRTTSAKKDVSNTLKPSPTENGSAKSTPAGRASSRKKSSINYAEEEKVKVEDNDEDDDVMTVQQKSNGKALKHDHDGDEDDDDVVPVRKTAGKGRQAKLKDDDDFDLEEDIDMKDIEPEEDFVVPDEDEHIDIDKLAKSTKAKATAARKRKSTEFEEDDEEGEEVKPKKARSTKASTPKKPAAKKGKAADQPEDAEAQAIFDSIPMVRPPTPPPRDGEKKFDFKAGAVNSGPPPGGPIEMPVGADECLAGLTFVFTGLLTHLSRDDGAALIKRYGGKVMTSPSSKTSFVVLGSDAGPKKLEVIKQHNLKTINEEGLFELIRRLPAKGGGSNAAARNAEKQEKELQKIKDMAALAEKEERAAAKAAKPSSSAPLQGRAANLAAPVNGPDTRLWTVKHAPTQLAQICGNKTVVERLQSWLRNFPKNMDKNFKMAGPDGSGLFRAVMIHGPPGIGKTTAAHLVAKLEGYDIVESNASDTRSKKLVEAGLKGVLDTTSLLGYFAGDGQSVQANKRKLCLIMDEVDGMSAGDRGGVGALAAVCKKTKVPMILICNERKLPKMKPFDNVTFALPFKRPTTDMIRSRIMTILFREGLKLPGNVVDALIEGTGADIRQIVNMISTVKLDSLAEDAAALDYDRGKQMSKAWEKSVILRPWDIVGRILGGGMFASSSKATLNDKIELYFNDHEFSYLMLAENYLGTNPIAASNYHGRDQQLKKLELADKAANSISEGDLVDRLIHGPEQQWSLMPTHAIMSFVRPASFMSGSMAGHGTAFPQWLGKNSTLGKNTRVVKEIQGHMRLRASGDRHEIRQQYVPSLWAKIIKKIADEGKEAVPEVIELMDSYFLTKDDYDGIMELGVGPMDQDKVKIDSQAKATFTRLYNAQSHPLPFMKANAAGPAKLAPKVKPDIEEALDDSEVEDPADVVEEEAPEGEEDGDVADALKKDKYVAAPKKRKAAAAKGKGKRKAAADDEEEQEEEEEKPAKKSRAKAPAGKGKAKK